MPRAKGVHFKKDGQTHYVKARKEVIVSGGTVGSAVLLMHSGIGHREHLQSLGVSLNKEDALLLEDCKLLQINSLMRIFYYLTLYENMCSIFEEVLFCKNLIRLI